MNAIEKLVARMLSFEGNFDGYPSMFCTDESLVSEAVRENNEGTPDQQPQDAVTLMSVLASEVVKTKEQYKNCRAFIEGYVNAAWECNMVEGYNPVHSSLSE